MPLHIADRPPAAEVTHREANTITRRGDRRGWDYVDARGNVWLLQPAVPFSGVPLVMTLLERASGPATVALKGSR
jgi:hypothetical protein